MSFDSFTQSKWLNKRHLTHVLKWLTKNSVWHIIQLSQNNKFAYYPVFKNEKTYLPWYLPTTSQCRLTYNRREDCKAWWRRQATLKALECCSVAGLDQHGPNTGTRAACGLRTGFVQHANAFCIPYIPQSRKDIAFATQSFQVTHHWISGQYATVRR